MRRSRLSRREPLRPDPEKVREWQRKSREEQQRQAKARSSPLKRKAAKRREALPEPVREEARGRTGGLCLRCLADGRERRGHDPHHLLPVRLFPRWERAPDNIVWLCRRCHERHELAFRRLEWAVLPAGCRAFLAAVASADGEAWAYLRKTYPGAGAELDGIEQQTTEDTS